ncbi:MAG: glycoside hydrolase family 25 protein [Porcipelethomonas sp.]
MKSAVKNIIIIIEFVFILFLSAAVFLFYRKSESKAIETIAEVNEKKEINHEEIERKVNENYYNLSGQKIYMSDSTFGEIWIPVIEDVPAFSKNTEQIKNRNGRMYYVENSEITSHLGVDVSVHQNDIDWEAVKNSGIDFAMIRLGYRGYGSGEAEIDENFVDNVKGARAAGLDVGVYFFSQAVTVDEAIDEAQLVLDNLNGLDITYPVVYDWEIIYGDSARTDDVPVDTLTDSCIAFCESVKDAGYIPMIYQNKKTTMFKLDLKRIKDYDFWLAEYNDQPSYYYDFTMWQFTSQGSVPGISGDVDLNICFKDYTK